MERLGYVREHKRERYTDRKGLIMNVHIVKIDETSLWSSDITKKAKRIYGVYVFNPEKRVHSSYVNPSYELYELSSQFFPKEGITEEENERFQDILDSSNLGSGVIYPYCHIIDNAEKIKEGELPNGKIGVYILEGLGEGFEKDPDSDKSDFEQLNDYLIEESIEYCNMNFV